MNDINFISLTQNRFSTVDSEDFKKLNCFKWCANHKKRGDFYAYRGVRHKGRSISKAMHREILNAKPGQCVDHVNGNTLDNRKVNLRICTNAQNIRNQKLRSNNIWGFKGVTYIPHTNKSWQAKITKDYKTIRLGLFNTKEEAAEIYDQAALQLFGEYSKLNFVSSKDCLRINGK